MGKFKVGDRVRLRSDSNIRPNRILEGRVTGTVFRVSKDPVIIYVKWSDSRAKTCSGCFHERSFDLDTSASDKTELSELYREIAEALGFTFHANDPHLVRRPDRQVVDLSTLDGIASLWPADDWKWGVCDCVCCEGSGIREYWARRKGKTGAECNGQSVDCTGDEHTDRTKLLRIVLRES